jgi:hypothetical protein
MDAIEATRKLLESMGTSVGDSVIIYSIGPPMIDAGYDTGAIVGALYALESRKVIELIPATASFCSDRLRDLTTTEKRPSEQCWGCPHGRSLTSTTAAIG